MTEEEINKTIAEFMKKPNKDDYDFQEDYLSSVDSYIEHLEEENHQLRRDLCDSMLIEAIKDTSRVKHLEEVIKGLAEGLEKIENNESCGMKRVIWNDLAKETLSKYKATIDEIKDVD